MLITVSPTMNQFYFQMPIFTEPVHLDNCVKMIAPNWLEEH